MPQNFETLKAAVILERLSRRECSLQMTHIKQKGGQAEPMTLEIKRRGNKFLCIYPQDKKNKNWGEIKTNVQENYINIGRHTFRLDEFAYLSPSNPILMDPSLPTCRKIVGTQRKLSLVELDDFSE